MCCIDCLQGLQLQVVGALGRNTNGSCTLTGVSVAIMEASTTTGEPNTSKMVSMQVISGGGQIHFACLPSILMVTQLRTYSVIGSTTQPGSTAMDPPSPFPACTTCLVIWCIYAALPRLASYAEGKPFAVRFSSALMQVYNQVISLPGSGDAGTPTSTWTWSSNATAVMAFDLVDLVNAQYPTNIELNFGAAYWLRVKLIAPYVGTNTARWAVGAGFGICICFLPHFRCLKVGRGP